MHPFTRQLQKKSDGKSDGKEYVPHNGSFATYFRNKQVKLVHQAQPARQSSIFRGCVVYITGYTVPSAESLKRLITANGGQICAYMGGRSYATHVIASNLTSRKRLLYARYTVVKPAWVVDSVRQGRKLDWTVYNLLGADPTSTKLEDEELPHGELQEDEEEGPELGELEEILSDEDDGVEKKLVDPADLAGPDVLEIEDNMICSPNIESIGEEGDTARQEWILAQRNRVDCTADNYIRNYFAKSRLHFLSTRKIALRRRCRNYVAPLNDSLHRTIMHVDFDSFFVAVALKNRPELVEEPVCVSHGSDGSDIASCNYIARKSGVTNGMWVGRARQLCPKLVCLPYDFEEYERCSGILYDVLFSLNPARIAAISVDEAIVDLPHCDYSIGTKVRDEIRQKTQIEVSVGFGPNILLAKLALKKAKPAGQCVLQSVADIVDVSVRDLPGVGRRFYSQLAELGINVVGDLSTVPLRDLQARLGNAMGQKLYGYGLGTDTADLRQLDVPVRSVSVEIGWGVRVIDLEEQLKFIEQCALELVRRVDAAEIGCETLTVCVHRKSPETSFIAAKYMGHGICDVISRSRRVPARLQGEQLVRVACELAMAVGCPPLEFRGLGLHIKAVTSAVPPARQHNLHAFFAPAISPTTSIASLTPSKKKMYTVPPRSKRKKNTLTQIVSEQIDLDVLAELPSQIQREIKGEMIRNAVVKEPTSLPAYHCPRFLGLQGSELRRVLREWVDSMESPTSEDARQFYEYARDATKQSGWLDVLEAVDYLSGYATKSEDWRVFCRIVDDEVQEMARKRTNR